MQVQHHFPSEVLASLEQTDEVQIEPRSPDGQPTQPITIWVVVVNGDVYARSYRGPKARWYQQLLQHPRGVLHVGPREIPFQAVRTDDRATNARVSDAYRRKYESKWPEQTSEMLRDEVLPTTLRLEPVSA